MHGQTPMLGDHRRHLRQLNLLRDAHDLRRKSGVTAAAAACARRRTVLDDGIGIVAERPAVALVTRLGPTGFVLLTPLLVIRRRRFGRRARGLRRALQPQHQLDQLFAAQPLKIASADPTKESAKSAPRKGVSNYRATTTCVDLQRRLLHQNDELVRGTPQSGGGGSS